MDAIFSWIGGHFFLTSVIALGIFVARDFTKYFVKRHLGKYLIDYNNPYGASELRFDRIPRFLAFRRRR